MALAKPRWLQNFETLRQSAAPVDTSTGMLYGVQESINPVENPVIPQQNPFLSENYNTQPMLEAPPQEIPPPEIVQAPVAQTVPQQGAPTQLPPSPYFLEPVDYGEVGDFVPPQQVTGAW